VSRRNAWLLPFFLNTVLVQALTFVLRPTVIYGAIELDVAAQWLGALGASFALVPLVLAVPTGQAVDRFGERRVMLAGAGVTLSATVVFITFADTITGLLAGSVMLGVGHLLGVVGQQSMVANRTPGD
jgi:MFS family permease